MSKLRSNFKSPSFLRPASRSKPVMPASNSTLAGPPPPKRRRTDDQPGPRQDADDTIVQRGEDEEWELPNQAALVNRAPVERAPSGSLAASRAPFGPTGNSIPSRAPSGSGVSSEEDGPFYMCTWRKPQFKKHKTWDGDAVLVVKDGGIRCALKCVETGRE